MPMQPEPASDAPSTQTPSDNAGTWLADATQVAKALAGPSVAPLDELGVIQVEGEDAAAFLHGQLTNDVRSLAGGKAQLDGYCTPKGRLLAIFLHLRIGASHLLVAPAGIVPALARRLSVYVLRSKVRVVDASAKWALFGAFGRGAAQALASCADLLGSAEVPMQEWSVTECTAGWLARLRSAPGAVDRLLLACPRSTAASLLERAAACGMNVVEPAAWWSAQIAAGEPAVFAATQERYVPQMLNLDALGAVNFKKGCYPGQEVVARTQYLGKLRRHLSIGHAEAARIGDDVFEDGKAEPIGSVVLAATSPVGGVDALFEGTDPAEGARLRVGAANGPVLSLRELPYGRGVAA